MNKYNNGKTISDKPNDWLLFGQQSPSNIRGVPYAVRGQNSGIVGQFFTVAHARQYIKTLGQQNLKVELLWTADRARTVKDWEDLPPEFQSKTINYGSKLKESFTSLNEAFVGVQLSASDAKKIAGVTKAADIDLKGLAEDVYGKLEDELLSVDEVLDMIKSPDADDMEDWSLNKAEYQKALKQALSVALNEYQQDNKDESKVKSPACKKMLALMDGAEDEDETYTSALKKVLNKFPGVNKKDLEKELDYWI